MTQSINKQMGRFPAMKTKFHLREILREMSCAHLVPASNDAPLQKGKGVLYCICVNVSSESDIFFCGVIDSFVFVFSYCLLVCREFIGHDHVNICRNVFLNILSQCSRFGVFSMEETNIAPALANTNNNLFGISCGLLAETTFSTSDIGFIHFDGAVQHWSISSTHSCTNTMAQIPRGLITHPNSSLELIGAHTLACFHEKQNSHKPTTQRQITTTQNHPYSYKKFVIQSTPTKLLARLHP